MTRARWTALIFLVLVGVTASVLRMAYLNDLATRADPSRVRVLDALHVTDPNAADRAEASRQFDSRFGERRLTTLMHVAPGAIFLLLAPLQFIPAIRRRHPRVHRWSGRLLVAMAFLTGIAAFYFGLIIPIGGTPERIAVALFGGGFLFAISRAWIAIRKKRIAVHREWMIRAFALALAISVVRVISVAVDLSLTPMGVRPPQILVVSLWIGWPLTIIIAELWIKQTRTRTALTGLT